VRVPRAGAESVGPYQDKPSLYSFRSTRTIVRARADREFVAQTATPITDR
jgi:hypothetical protein